MSNGEWRTSNSEFISRAGIQFRKFSAPARGEVSGRRRKLAEPPQIWRLVRATNDRSTLSDRGRGQHIFAPLSTGVDGGQTHSRPTRLAASPHVRGQTR